MPIPATLGLRAHARAPREHSSRIHAVNGLL